MTALCCPESVDSQSMCQKHKAIRRIKPECSVTWWNIFIPCKVVFPCAVGINQNERLLGIAFINRETVTTAIRKGHINYVKKWRFTGGWKHRSTIRHSQTDRHWGTDPLPGTLRQIDTEAPIHYQALSDRQTLRHRSTIRHSQTERQWGTDPLSGTLRPVSYTHLTLPTMPDV